MSHRNLKSKRLVITGTPRYISHMYKHLRKEHPSTRRRMKMIGARR